MNCTNCHHGCHCGNSGQCVTCKCASCEHPNPLDEFWKNLQEDSKDKD